MFRLGRPQGTAKLSQPPKKCRPPANHIDPKASSDLAVIPMDRGVRQQRPANPAPSQAPPPRSSRHTLTPGPRHHGICETRIYTGDGLRGQRPSFSVLVSLCIDISTAQPRFCEKKLKKWLRNKTPTASMSKPALPSSTPMRGMRWKAVHEGGPFT
ncbi:hypothetical protein CKAH01_11047 [Colletotrichum kahawae]|uniref:Uncharacterized protein n=1 Tax=Colletotrichum kahawae TaxID=34407 RepID=A0AAD9XW09_COLKA|nr:hypothetical protein CKAH01_11047 [Colletotrichum kahawae]